MIENTESMLFPHCSRRHKTRFDVASTFLRRNTRASLCLLVLIPFLPQIRNHIYSCADSGEQSSSLSPWRHQNICLFPNGPCSGDACSLKWLGDITKVATGDQNIFRISSLH